MNDTLIGIERDIVVEWFLKNGSDLIIKVSPEKNILVKKDYFKTLKEGIIFIPFGVIPEFSDITEGSDFYICFFYKGRGIFFQSPVKLLKNGFAFVISKTVFKQADTQEESVSVVTSKIYYTGSGKKGLAVDAHSSELYPLFKCRLWQYFPEKEIKPAYDNLFEIADLIQIDLPPSLLKLLQLEKKILYAPEKKIPSKNYFPYDAGITTEDLPPFGNEDVLDAVSSLNYEACIPFSDTPESKVHSVFAIDPQVITVSPFDVTDSVSMLPVCRYLSAPHAIIPDSIQGRVQPFDILFINETYIIFGSTNGKNLLQKGSEYPVSIFVKLPVGKREIFSIVLVSRIFSNKDGISCFVCKYTTLEEEDRRFLFERINGTRYS